MNNANSKKEAEADWIHLPADVNVQSLWECLHDAKIGSLNSDLLNRTVTMTFDVFYINEFHNLPLDTVFIFNFEGVQSVRVTSYEKWPGEFVRPDNITREEESALIKEYHAKWREESLSWNEFEKLIKQNNSLFDVMNSDLASNNQQITIRFEGILNDHDYYICIRAKALSIQRSDGLKLKLEDFMKLGEYYWDAFSKRKLKR